MKFEKIYIELSDICGLKCNFCPGEKEIRGEMDKEKFRVLAPKISNYARIFTFHILGDPLLIRDLEFYINVAKIYNMTLELTTSGFYLNRKKQDLLLKSENIRQINISLNAFLVQKKIKFDSYFSRILNLIFTHLDNKNPSFINLRLWNLDENFNAPPENTRIYDFLEQIFKVQIDKKNAKNRLARKIFLHQAKSFKWADTSLPVKRQKGKCHALSKQLGILSNGTVVPCCMDTKGEINLGNIFNENLDIILNKNRFTRMKEGFACGDLVETLCRCCEFYKVRTMPG